MPITPNSVTPPSQAAGASALLPKGVASRLPVKPYVASVAVGEAVPDTPSAWMPSPAEQTALPEDAQDATDENAAGNSAHPKRSKETHQSRSRTTQEEAGHSDFSDKAGSWAFKHRTQMVDNPLGWYGVRNALNASVALAALAAVIVPVRSGMAKVGTAALSPKGMIGIKSIDQSIGKVASNPMAQQMAGVGASFATFRIFFKVWKDNYDRIFTNADSEEQSQQAIHDLPVNIMKDFKRIAPSEYAATGMAAVPLVAIRGGLGGPAQASSLRDMLGSVPAYMAFFEMTERLFHGFSKDESAKKGIFHSAPDPDDFVVSSGSQDAETNRGHVRSYIQEKGKIGTHEHEHKDEPFAAFVDDTPTRVIFRKGGAMVAGIMPYIWLNRNMYARQGMGKVPFAKVEKVAEKGAAMNEKIAAGGMKPGNESYVSSFRKEFLPYQMFPAYTVLSEIYLNHYDKFFDGLQKKYHHTRNVAEEGVDVSAPAANDAEGAPQKPSDKVRQSQHLGREEMAARAVGG